jgi:hypothetical protein
MFCASDLGSRMNAALAVAKTVATLASAAKPGGE